MLEPFAGVLVYPPPPWAIAAGGLALAGVAAGIRVYLKSRITPAEQERRRDGQCDVGISGYAFLFYSTHCSIHEYMSAIFFQIYPS